MPGQIYEIITNNPKFKCLLILLLKAILALLEDEPPLPCPSIETDSSNAIAVVELSAPSESVPTKPPEIDRRAATRFFDFLLNDNCNGARPLSIQKLRTKLLKDYMNKSRGTNPTFVAALVIKTWNAYRKGKSVGTLKYDPECTLNGVTVGEPYPVMS